MPDQTATPVPAPTTDATSEPTTEPKAYCGLVMPISAIDLLPESHWLEVKAILSDAISNAGFVARLVSEAPDVGTIQKSIVQNLYDDTILVCDVSARNPNVMTELGMRLAFDKATVIVKDDQTPYSFDIQNIEHIEYPRDLRFSKVVRFKEKLTAKVKATHHEATTNPEYSAFLKQFGKFTVAKLETVEVPGLTLISDELRELKRQFARFNRIVSVSSRTAPNLDSVASEMQARIVRETIVSLLEEQVDLGGSEGVERIALRMFERFPHLTPETVDQLADAAARHLGNFSTH